MIEINPSRFKSAPFAHQLEGVKALVENKYFALLDEMGAGKSKQVIDAACVLAEAGEIDTIVIVAPASVRTVWCDETIGEIRKHCWIPSSVCEYALGKINKKWNDPEASLLFLVTNYEILRGEKHLQWFKEFTNHRNILLICDESSYIKSRTAAQTKAIMKLRKHCARVVILNGTPVTHSPVDLFSQMKVLSPEILGENFYVFRSEYCTMVPMRYGGGRSFQMISGYKNLDKLTARCAPYVLRRLKKDCLDLPDKLFTVREVALSTESWKRYQELKKDAVMSLGNGDTLLEPNAATRIMRLGQITSGHVGRSDVWEYPAHGEANVSQPSASQITQGDAGGVTEDLSSEKLDWAVQYLTEECSSRYVIVWCRWRRERERLAKLLCKGSCEPTYVTQLYGGQAKWEREHAIALFSSIDSVKLSERAVLLAQPQSGGFGLNLVAAQEEIFLSNDWSWGIRAQAEDRAHRPGQKHNVLIVDVLATSPTGGKTIDHVILKSLRGKEDLSKLTSAAWRRELSE